MKPQIFPIRKVLRKRPHSAEVSNSHVKARSHFGGGVYVFRLLFIISFLLVWTRCFTWLLHMLASLGQGKVCLFKIAPVSAASFREDIRAVKKLAALPITKTTLNVRVRSRWKFEVDHYDPFTQEAYVVRTCGIR